MRNFGHIDKEKAQKALEAYKEGTLENAARVLDYSQTHTYRILKHFFGNEYSALAKKHKIAASRKSILKAHAACRQKFGENYTQILGKMTYQKYGRAYYSRLGVKTICKRSNRKPFGSAFENEVAKVLSRGCSFVLYEPILITGAEYLMPDFFIPPNTVIEVIGNRKESYIKRCQKKLDTYRLLNLHVVLVAKSLRYVKKLLLSANIVVYEKNLDQLPQLVQNSGRSHDGVDKLSSFEIDKISDGGKEVWI